MGEDPREEVHQPDNSTTYEHTAPEESWFDMDLNVGPSFKVLRLDPVLRRAIEMGRRVDASNEARGYLGGLARLASARRRFTPRVAAALQILAAATDVSPAQLVAEMRSVLGDKP